jgi:hypothetical protein
MPTMIGDMPVIGAYGSEQHLLNGAAITHAKTGAAYTVKKGGGRFAKNGALPKDTG